MTVNMVTVVCDLDDGSGNPRSTGTGYFLPTVAVRVDDPVTPMEIDPTVRVPVVFSFDGPPSVKLVACDNTGTSPTGWQWIWTPPAPLPVAKFAVNYSGGAVQYLSDLALS